MRERLAPSCDSAASACVTSAHQADYEVRLARVDFGLGSYGQTKQITLETWTRGDISILQIVHGSGGYAFVVS